MVLKKDNNNKIQPTFKNNGGEHVNRRKNSDIIKQWAECSSCHGIPNIARHHSTLIKSIWTVCFLASFIYCCYTLRKSTLDYMSFEVNSQITIQRFPSIEFPTVTLCNKEYINFVKHNDLKNVVDEAIEAIDKSLIYNLTTLDIINYMDYYIRYLGYSANLSKIDRANYGFSLDDMLISCRFNNMNCDNSSFGNLFADMMGNCFQFNSAGLGEKALMTSTPGRRNALRIEINIGAASPLSGMSKSRGMTIYVHNKSYLPMPDVEGVSLSPGFETDIVVKQVFLNKQPSPYSKCTPPDVSVDSSLGRSTTKLFGQYNQKYCLQVCQQNYTVSRCGCYDLTLPPLAPWPACDMSTLVSCIYPLHDEFYSGEAHLACFEQCPDECSNIIFNYEISTSDFPTQFYASLLQKQHSRRFQNLSQMKENILAFNVFYDDISYTTIDEVPAKTLEQYIADIGGIMGLCIGTSLLSFVELLELGLLLLFSLFERRDRRIKE